MNQRNHVGELRPSQLLHTYGVGATVELPEITTLVLGLDDWPRELGRPVAESRLLAAVRATCGSQVQRLISPPVALNEGESAGVPVTPFPRWLRCSICGLLSPIESGVFEFREDRWRPERSTYVHAGCQRSKSKRPPSAFPARYLIACANGHLDDFPWYEFVHGSIACNSTLRLREVGSSGRAADVQLSCDTCKRNRRLSFAFGQKAAQYLPPSCRGRHPHLGISQACQERPQTLILGASNAWFPVQMSALSIPTREGELAQAVEEAWNVLETLPAGVETLRFALENVPPLRRVGAMAEALGENVVLQAIEQRRSAAETSEQAEDLRRPEWEVLSSPASAPETPDFRLRAVGAPAAFATELSDVVLVERLRVVSALRGFTRLTAPDDLAVGTSRVVGLAREAPRWLPCNEVRGEGIFVRFSEPELLAWERRYSAGENAHNIEAGNRTWRERRNLNPNEGWPGVRYILLHSFAHALIRELALECGYTASSIRERIYAMERVEPDPMAGVLLYTAAPDSEGTLGGLVALGEPAQLGPLIAQALERAQLCSSDPLCAEHDPCTDSSVHAAACHACQFASETSCERGNRFLDRSALIATMAHDAGYFTLP
jgi:hypothetical protein